jgi:hypothetical protein
MTIIVERAFPSDFLSRISMLHSSAMCPSVCHHANHDSASLPHFRPPDDCGMKMKTAIRPRHDHQTQSGGVAKPAWH